MTAARRWNALGCICVAVGSWLAAIGVSTAQTTVATTDLRAADGASGDGFGRSVAISGDTLIVGAYGHDAAGEDAGAAYVFVRDAARGWVQQQKLVPPALLPGDHFGWSVAIDGDLAVVGAPADRRAGSGVGFEAFNRGAAYVFQRVGGLWQQTLRLQPEPLVSGDQFGFAVAANGERVMVSAPHRGPGASGPPGVDAANFAGLVALFRRTAAGWVTEAEWSWSGGDWAAKDWFGFSVALDTSDTVIGSPRPESRTSPTVRHREGDGWSRVWPSLRSTDGTGDGAWLGSVSAVARDLDGSLVVLDTYCQAAIGHVGYYVRDSGGWGGSCGRTARRWRVPAGPPRRSRPSS